MSEMFGSYTWLALSGAVLFVFIVFRIVNKSYWKNSTLPPNKALFQKSFTLTYNDVFNDLSCVKTEWRNVFKAKEFSEHVITLHDKEKVKFKGMFTGMKYHSLVSRARKMEKLLNDNNAILSAGKAPQDESIIKLYTQHKDEFEKFDDAYSDFLKKVSDIPKPVKQDVW